MRFFPEIQPGIDICLELARFPGKLEDHQQRSFRQVIHMNSLRTIPFHVTIITMVATISAGLMLSGCVSPSSSGGLSAASQQRMQHEVNRDLALEEIRRLRDQVSAMERQFSSIDQRFLAMEQTLQQQEIRSRDLSQSASAVSPADIRRLDQSISQLQAARAQDRQETVTAAIDAVNKVLANHPSLKAARAPAPAPAASTTEYLEVELGPGDTLTIVAQAFGTTVNELVRINNLKDPNKVSQGQRIRVPKR
jgi:LysM repeat protein/outer membrane murein-binding lipoprotein Lpp